jgi:hypothetical protein
MAHRSPGDTLDHYTIVGLDKNNEPVKDTHVKLDQSKQCVSPPSPLLSSTRLITIASVRTRPDGSATQSLCAVHDAMK